MTAAGRSVSCSFGSACRESEILFSRRSGSRSIRVSAPLPPLATTISVDETRSRAAFDV